VLKNNFQRLVHVDERVKSAENRDTSAVLDKFPSPE
jgi:hypothetical protein